MNGRMLEAQKPIAEWMTLIIQKHRISARSWAEKAKLGKDTVSRAIKPDCTFVTKASTLGKLAEVVNEHPPGAAAAVPSAAILRDVLDAVLGALPQATIVPDDVLTPLAEALRDTLLQLADEPEAALDPKVATALARATARRLDRPNA